MREKDLSEALSAVAGGAGVTDVRMPPGKNYAFVEFETHQGALTVVSGA